MTPHTRARNLFGMSSPTPIILAPVGSLRAFDPDGA